MSELRVIGAPADVARDVEAIKGVLRVTRETAPRPSRKNKGQVIVYMEVEDAPDGSRPARMRRRSHGQ